MWASVDIGIAFVVFSFLFNDCSQLLVFGLNQLLLLFFLSFLLESRSRTWEAIIGWSGYEDTAFWH